MKTIRRDWLKRQIEKGNVEAKCQHDLTDDYQFDNANDFGKTDWMEARMSRPTYKEVTNYVGNKVTVVDDRDFIDGIMNFKDYEFTGKSGGAYRTNDETIHLYVHSNLSYTLRIK